MHVTRLLLDKLKLVIDRSAFPFVAATASVLDTALEAPFQAFAATTLDASLRSKIHSASANQAAPAHIVPIQTENRLSHISLVSKTSPMSEMARVATLLARACLCSAGGKSTGALHLVIVHEERHAVLMQQLEQSATALLSGTDNAAKQADVVKSSLAELKGMAGRDSNFVNCGSRGAFTIIDKVQTDSDLPGRLAGLPCLAVMVVRSTEAAIAIADRWIGHTLSVFASKPEM